MSIPSSVTNVQCENKFSALGTRLEGPIKRTAGEQVHVEVDTHLYCSQAYLHKQVDRPLTAIVRGNPNVCVKDTSLMK